MARARAVATFVDLHGIFCAFVCDACEAEKKAAFRPDIFFGAYPKDEPLEEGRLAQTVGCSASHCPA